MLKNLRVILSLSVLGLLTFYFVDFAGVLPVEFNILARVQFIPALMSRNIVIVICLILCTLLFGRVYCSFICPLGIFQDIVIRCSKGAYSKKKSLYRKNNSILRWSVLTICVIAFFSGFTVIAALLDPYGAYGRGALHLFKPVYLSANNVLAAVFHRFGNYTLYNMEVTILSVFSFAAASFTFIIIGVLAWTNGRLYCNSICPVGTVLGFINKYSVFKININGDKCVSCGVCAKKCKASCIDARTKTIDYSRCVNCFNCINVCGQKAVSFSVNGFVKSYLNSGNNAGKGVAFNILTALKGWVGQAAPAAGCPPYYPNIHLTLTKRQFLLAGLSAVMAAPAAVLARAGEKLPKNRKNAVSPPGSVSAKRLLKHCTSCHLCVSKCPSKALKPSFTEYGIGGMMAPVMDFERGFCNFDCTICTEVCPNNALVKLTKEQKHRLQIGRVVLKPELCVVHTKGWNCGACSEHCPTQAVKMIPYRDGLTIPFIDADICVGCGGCEYICPVRPQRAIYVEGSGVHGQARAFDAGEKSDDEITDFGF